MNNSPTPSFANNPNIHLLDHPLAQHALADLRDAQTSTARFRQRARELAKFLILEATRDLKTVEVQIQTPLATTTARRLAQDTIVIAPILRAGLAMVEPAMELLPEAEVRHIGLYRNETTLKPVYYYLKLPERYEPTARVLIIDPMLATGGSAVAAVDIFKELGVTRIDMLCLIASPQGLQFLAEQHPDIHIFTTAIDDRLDDNGFIQPGLGDAGDRTFGTH